LIHANIVNMDIGHLAWVAFHYALANWGAVLIAVTGSAWMLLSPRIEPRRGAGWWRQWRRRLLSLDTPLVTSSVPFMPVALLLSMTLIVTRLGLHKGNDVLYYDQLISPFLYWVAAVYTDRLPSLRVPSLLLLIITLLGWPPAYATNMTDVRNVQAQWREMEDLIARHAHVYTSPPLAHLERRQGKPVYDTGQTEFFRDGARGGVGGGSGEYLRRGEELANQIEVLARRKHFDLLILSERDRPFISDGTLSQNYVRTGSKTLVIGDLEWDFRIYRPKPGG
jgi:hypothetical protein